MDKGNEISKAVRLLEYSEVGLYMPVSELSGASRRAARLAVSKYMLGLSQAGKVYEGEPLLVQLEGDIHFAAYYPPGVEGEAK